MEGVVVLEGAEGVERWGAARFAAGLVDDLEVAHYPFPLVDLDGGAICVDEGVENRKIRGRRPTLDRFILRFGY